MQEPDRLWLIIFDIEQFLWRFKSHCTRVWRLQGNLIIVLKIFIILHRKVKWNTKKARSLNPCQLKSCCLSNYYLFLVNSCKLQSRSFRRKSISFLISSFSTARAITNAAIPDLLYSR